MCYKSITNELVHNVVRMMWVFQRRATVGRSSVTVSVIACHLRGDVTEYRTATRMRMNTSAHSWPKVQPNFV
jgi:acyl-CoA hydrolase